MKDLKVGLFGVGGFAANYLYTLQHPLRENVKLAAAVDPYNKNCDLCPVYDTAEEMYKNHPDLNLVAVATPICFHADQVCEAFANGCHTVVEKPMAATTEEARRMIAARDKAGRMLSVGFQLCADEAVRTLKADADKGLFGKPLNLRCIVLWPRNHAYYHRGSGWAGKKMTADCKPVYDSVLSNATAHYLMNILFMLGEPLRSFDCRTYRANPIETFDTAVLQGTAASGAHVFLAVSHAAGPHLEQNPLFVYEYENATLRFGASGETGSHFTACFRDGTVKDYGEINKTYLPNFWNMVDVIRDGAPVFCPPETAMLHVDTLERMRVYQPEAVPFPDSWIREKDGYVWVPGLAEALFGCFRDSRLPNWDFCAESLNMTGA